MKRSKIESYYFIDGIIFKYFEELTDSYIKKNNIGYLTVLEKGFDEFGFKIPRRTVLYITPIK